MQNIKINSKLVKKNDIFVCIHDSLLDRHLFINDKNINKSNVLVVDKNVKTNIPYIKVNNTNDTLFDLYNTYYDHPFNKLKLIGITGTDGKTTTAEMTYNLLNNYEKTAYLGTNGFYYDKKITTKNTTPSLEDIFRYSNILNKNGYKYLVMESSSEGLLHNRCYKIPFMIASLTNITIDHLNVHKTKENYIESKKRLFRNSYISILNKDDNNFRNIKKASKNIITYGQKRSNYRIKNIKYHENHTTFDLIYKRKIYHVYSPFLGKFNVYNLTLAIAIVNTIKNDLQNIIKSVKKLKTVSGRMNIYNTKKGYKVILDYAHTTNATKEVLTFINKIKKARIITVAGCAGGRDKTKRKDIGKLLSDYSDITIFTMDDPRNEDINSIFKDMLTNVNKRNYLLIANRKKAIKKALNIARKDDYVLILGKGKDNYMAIKDKYIKYNDYNIIKNHIN